MFCFSGLTAPEGPDRGVTPVYLRCSQGQLRWSYPRGALRVVLRAGRSGGEFRGCLKVAPDFGGARVFLEGPRSLTLLFAPDDEVPQQLARCFHSRDGQAALYVEAVNSQVALRREEAAFSYHLQPLPSGRKFYEEEEDCRPCTPEEMVRLYCTSDFVARGIITGVSNNEQLARGEVRTRVSVVYRQLEAVFLPRNTSDPYQYQYRAHHEGTLMVPLHCGARHGPGEFLFIGRMVLGEPFLTCAPRLEEWAPIRAAALDDGTAQCILET
ncbi:meteorin-like protein [Anabrus simplex]|uniref:meteorin-like protein n=1 Tax=Anabrus simplex TaxID=316456 RepID=UPI0035A2C366